MALKTGIKDGDQKRGLRAPWPLRFNLRIVPANVARLVAARA